MANSVNVQLTANDLISPVILDIKKQLDALSLKTSFSFSLGGSDFSKLTQGMEAFKAKTMEAEPAVNELGGLLTGLGTGAALGSILIATEAVKSLIGSIGEATQLQTQAITSASIISTNLGINFLDAKNMVAKTQVDIANAAAALPGITQDYNSIFTRISGTIAGQLRGQASAFEGLATDITKRIGILASITHSDPGFSGDIFNRLISGTATLGEAMTTEVFSKNPQLIQAFQQLGSKFGIDIGEGWKNLTTKSRLALTQMALRQASPDSLVNSFSGTAEALAQGLRTKLLDPQVGMLGVLRGIPDMGGRSVLDGVQNLLQAVTNLSDSAGQVMAHLGIRVDPLKPVLQFLDWISDFTNGINIAVSSYDFKMPKLDWSGIAASLAGSFNFLGNGLRSAIEQVNWQDVGRLVYGGLKNGLLIFSDFLLRLDYPALGKLLWDIFAGVMDSLTGFLYSAFDDLWAFIQTGLQPVSNAIKGIVDGILGFFQDIYNITMGMVNSAKAALAPVTSALQSTIAPVASTLQSATSPDAIIQSSTRMLQAVTDPVGAAVDSAGQLVGGILFPTSTDTSSTNNVTSHQHNHISINGDLNNHDDLLDKMTQHLGSLFQKQQKLKIAN